MIKHRPTGLRASALAYVLWGAAALAQAQSLQLACPANAAAGDPATPLTINTSSTAPLAWDVSYGTTGTWTAATNWQHPAWFTPAPGQGNWLVPGPIDTGIVTIEPFFYRSPPITVDARINLGSIQTALSQATDNYYNATGLVNASTPTAGSLTAYAGPSGFAALNPTVSVAGLPWVTGSNQLLLEASNAGSPHTGSNPTGVYASITITATCLAVPAVPASVPANSPWALLLAALGVAGVAARRWRVRA